MRWAICKLCKQCHPPDPLPLACVPWPQAAADALDELEDYNVQLQAVP